MPLFEVAVIELETKKNVDEGMPAEKAFHGPIPVLAKDADTAKLLGVQKLDVCLNLNQAKVMVRPFA